MKVLEYVVVRVKAATNIPAPGCDVFVLAACPGHPHIEWKATSGGVAVGDRFTVSIAPKGVAVLAAAAPAGGVR